MQKDEYDQNHQGHRLKEGLDDFFHALGHRQGGVESNGIIEIGGKLLLHLLHERARPLHGIDCVRSRELVDSQDGRVLAVETSAEVINLRAEIYPGDIFHADDRAVGVCANDNVLEVLLGHKAASGIHCKRKYLPLRHGLAANLSGGIDVVLSLNRANDFRHGDVERGEPVGLHPDAHRVLARTENADASHAGDTRHRIVDVDIGVVRQEGRIIRSLRREQHEHSKRRRCGLLDRHAKVPNVLRQLRASLRLPHLREDLVRRRHRRRVKNDVEGHHAIVGIDRVHVVHALDAAHLLLDGCGH